MSQVDVPLPRWAEVARTICRVWIMLWAALIVVGWIVRGILWVLDARPELNPPSWVSWLSLLLAFGPLLVGGLLWLAGEFIRGLREPKD